MRVDWWSLSDEQIARQCEEDRYRASGPGGQKRNKTDSAIRLRHQPTGLIVTATESRSQHENRSRALRRMREALAFQLRQPIAGDEVPDVVRAACASGRLEVRTRSPEFLPISSYVLDLLQAEQGQLSSVAERLGVTTASVASFLRETTDGWQAAQNIRKAWGQKPLH